MSTKRLTVTHRPTAEAAPVTTEVEVIYPDMLRAEQMGVRLGVPGLSEASLTGLTLWAWAALRRTGQTHADAKPFLNGLVLDVEPVRTPEDAETSEAAPVSADPTPPAPGTGWF